jgi:hypothetical protein
MSRYQFELATPADDADLRHVLAATPMEGRISVTFRREPSWFAAAAVDGPFRQVVAARDLATGRIFGFGCRSIRQAYINGLPGAVGYLSNLRVLAAYRKRGLVARGYAFFRTLHQDGRVPYYLTTIADGNDAALATLTSGRAGLPSYHPTGRYITVVIPLHRSGNGADRPARGTAAHDVTVRSARPDDLPAMLDFLATEGARRQFFPCYQAEDFLAPDGKLQGLGWDSLVLAERRGRIVGTLAGWDQHAYRQTLVNGYRGWLGRVRPLYNVFCKLRGIAGLPAPGSSLRYLLATLPLVADDEPDVFAALLNRVRARAAGGPCSHLLVGLHEADPLLRLACRYESARYVTRLYLVCWKEGDERRLGLDGRCPYLELGSL